MKNKTVTQIELKTDRERIEKALSILMDWGQVNGIYQKAWVIDQVVRALTGSPVRQTEISNKQDIIYTDTVMLKSEPYRQWVALYCAPEVPDDPDTGYTWSEGIAP